VRLDICPRDWPEVAAIWSTARRFPEFLEDGEGEWRSFLFLGVVDGLDLAGRKGAGVELDII